MQTITRYIMLPHKLRYHVRIRGGAQLQNGAWSMMLDAATLIKLQWAAIAILAVACVTVWGAK